MHVNVNFTLNIDPAEWACSTASTIRPDAPDAMDRIAAEVRAHAENVVRDLFADMGWTVEEAPAHTVNQKYTRRIIDGSKSSRAIKPYRATCICGYSVDDKDREEALARLDSHIANA